MFDELRQRNVHRVALAYLAGAWLLIQVVETLTPDILPGVVFRATVIVLAIGFLPAMILAWKFEWTPEGLQREQDIAPGAARSDSRFLDRTITLVLVLAVAYFAIDKFLLDPARDEAEIVAATEEATKRALSGAFLDEFRDRSILVVPFLNFSADPDQEFFADGISEEILNQLANIEELRVISRSTSWTFKGQDVDVEEAHRALDVSHILEGSVRKAGNTVRVTAQLIDARTNSHLWSETYDEPLDDIFAVQEEISVAVADQMHLEILTSQSPHEGIDPRAYELYLRASAISEFGSGRAIEARRYLLQALAIEPDYVPALYDLAVNLNLSEDLGYLPEDMRIRRQAVMEIVNRIIELAPDSAFAHDWQAFIAMRWHNDLVGAAPHLEKSLQFVNRTDLHVWVAGAIDLLQAIGRHDEAVTLGQYWINRDPYCSFCVGRVARAMSGSGRFEEAALLVESQLERRNPSPLVYWNTGVSFLIAGDAGKALDYFDKIPDGYTDLDKEYARAFALYSLGRIDEFEAILADRVSNANSGSAEGIARLYAWSNQPDEAFRWLERMVDDLGEEWALEVKTELYEPIKSDPRWQAFLKKYGAEDKANIAVRFEPHYPPTLQRAVDALATR